MMFRDTFKSNCSRSGIPDKMSERIMGHSDKNGNLDGHFSVSRRHGEISEEELIQARDQSSADNGE